MRAVEMWKFSLILSLILMLEVQFSNAAGEHERRVLSETQELFDKLDKIVGFRANDYEVSTAASFVASLRINLQSAQPSPRQPQNQVVSRISAAYLGRGRNNRLSIGSGPGLAAVVQSNIRHGFRSRARGISANSPQVGYSTLPDSRTMVDKAIVAFRVTRKRNWLTLNEMVRNSYYKVQIFAAIYAYQYNLLIYGIPANRIPLFAELDNIVTSNLWDFLEYERKLIYALENLLNKFDKIYKKAAQNNGTYSYKKRTQIANMNNAKTFTDCVKRKGYHMASENVIKYDNAHEIDLCLDVPYQQYDGFFNIPLRQSDLKIRKMAYDACLVYNSVLRNVGTKPLGLACGQIIRRQYQTEEFFDYTPTHLTLAHYEREE